MKKVCVVTGTRAEYSLLKEIMYKLRSHDEFELQIIATGMHLSSEYGLTYLEIEKDGFFIDEKIYMDLSDNTKYGITRSMGHELVEFSEAIRRLEPDMMVLLGDRYEIFIAATAAMMLRIPISHLCGGEVTSGAIDDVIRHCITKMSYLHFTNAEEYRQRVIQLGESPDRVFSHGDTGIENIKGIKLLTHEELEYSLNFKLDKPYLLVTFHPETLDRTSPTCQMEALLSAVDSYPELKIIFTKANSDEGGIKINEMIDNYVANRTGSAIAYTSLGQLRYLSAMKYASAVIGNSSSGIIEAPEMSIPTLNIGQRQQGRLKANSIVDCNADYDSIKNGLNIILDKNFMKDFDVSKNPYKGENVSTKVIETLEDFLLKDKVDLKKIFFDLRS